MARLFLQRQWQSVALALLVVVCCLGCKDDPTVQVTPECAEWPVAFEVLPDTWYVDSDGQTAVTLCVTNAATKPMTLDWSGLSFIRHDVLYYRPVANAPSSSPLGIVVQVDRQHGAWVLPSESAGSMSLEWSGPQQVEVGPGAQWRKTVPVQGLGHGDAVRVRFRIRVGPDASYLETVDRSILLLVATSEANRQK